MLLLLLVVEMLTGTSKVMVGRLLLLVLILVVMLRVRVLRAAAGTPAAAAEQGRTGTSGYDGITAAAVAGDAPEQKLGARAGEESESRVWSTRSIHVIVAARMRP
jgi:hypothetical protein